MNELAQTLLDSPEPRIYLANPGNLGDAAIRAGTIKFFRSIRLDYTEVRAVPQRIERGTFIFGGGGAWCNNWDNARRVVDALDVGAPSVIVLPSTYAKRSWLYNDSRVTFFRREQWSRRVLPRSVYHQDMAFYLWDDLTPKDGKGVGHFMRTDKESAGFDIPICNYDISGKGTTYDGIDGFVGTINKVQEVHTDRLHVAIIGCMLRKKVVFYEGNYWKNEAMYETRMKGVYDVTFRRFDRGRHTERDTD